MAIVLSHTTALTLLRRLGGPPPALPSAGLPLLAPTDEEAVIAWEKSVGCPETLPINTLVASAAGRARRRVVHSHQHRGALPDGSLFETSGGILCVTPECLCVQMAPLLTKVELLVLMYELMGTYSIRTDGATGMCSRRVPLLTKEALGCYLGQQPRQRGTRQAEWCLAHAVEGSASPMETRLAIRLSLSPAMGGYGMTVKAMNQEMRFSGIGGGIPMVRKPDILLAHEGRDGILRSVGIEYDGEGHLDTGRHVSDILRSNELAAGGLREFVVSKSLYDNDAYLDGLVESVKRELCIPRHHLTHAEHERRAGLRRELHDELSLIDGMSWNGRERGRLRGERGQSDRDEEVPLEAYGV